jgi:predicted metal-dependent hydrolase
LPVFTDDEFGTIVVRRSSRSTHIRIKVAPNGRLQASLPLYAPLFLVKRLLKNSRQKLRELLAAHHKDSIFTDGMQIGKSHTLHIRYRTIGNATITKQDRHIIATLPSAMPPHHPAAAKLIREKVIEALRLEAKSHLPKRLRFLAEQHGYTYEKVRFSHAGSRWGSCSSSGTISLNIALMKLPFELIDYVLIHELSHTVEMNHSQDFWQRVAQADPQYKQHRLNLKKESPSI